MPYLLGKRDEQNERKRRRVPRPFRLRSAFGGSGLRSDKRDRLRGIAFTPGQVDADVTAISGALTIAQISATLVPVAVSGRQNVVQKTNSADVQLRENTEDLKLKTISIDVVLPSIKVSVKRETTEETP